jgi:hypothetical protein
MKTATRNRQKPRQERRDILFYFPNTKEEGTLFAKYVRTAPTVCMLEGC